MTFYTFRPLGAWTESDSKNRRGAHLFKASWTDTLNLLERELGYLDARNVVLQVDASEQDIRLDGQLRAAARVGHPGVRISFDSKHGPLTYATDAHERWYAWSKLDGWQANVRAVALGLEALRAVDRYGITRRAEQYVGWKQLPAGSGAEATHMTSEQACEVLGHLARWDLAPSDADPQIIRRALRDARGFTHPDRHGGDRTLWDQVEQAARVLGVQT